MTTELTEGCGRAALVPLAWDTAQFGFPVARLAVPGDDAGAALGALEEARRRGTALVYWQTEPGVPVPERLLARFTGRLVDRKVTFALDLPGGGAALAAEGGRVWEYSRGPASKGLRSLALAAGVCSRFRTDPLFPPEKFVGLYTTWAERSARHEIADAVLVCGSGADPEGMVTLTESGGVANIGLIAVAAVARRRGLGRLLMGAAHRWMAGRGASRATVVTQQENAAACGLYQSCGYRTHEVKYCYHFWPQQKATARTS
jgi:ribosomal protein S18 acetylase RimI-like enzyme